MGVWVRVVWMRSLAPVLGVWLTKPKAWRRVTIFVGLLFRQVNIHIHWGDGG